MTDLPNRRMIDSTVGERHAGLARDLARAAFLLRSRGWRHLRDEFCGHAFLPLAALSGAVADALLSAPPDFLSAAHVLCAADWRHREPVADLLQTLGAADG